MGKTFANGDRLLLDGDTRQITYNGEVIFDFNKKPSRLSRGIAFSDGGGYQDPSSLQRGLRNVPWIDFGGYFEALITILGFELNRSTPKGKGTNGGKPTIEDKIDDGINAVDNGANAVKAAIEAKRDVETKHESDSVTVLTYDKGKLIKEERRAK